MRIESICSKFSNENTLYYTNINADDDIQVIIDAQP